MNITIPLTLFHFSLVIMIMAMIMESHGRIVRSEKNHGYGPTMISLILMGLSAFVYLIQEFT